MSMSVTVRFFAAARVAAGTRELTIQASDLTELIADLSARSTELDRVIPQCSILINEVVTHDRSVELSDGDVVDFLPPFAGG